MNQLGENYSSEKTHLYNVNHPVMIGDGSDDIGVKIGYPKRCRVRSSFLLLKRQVCSPAAEALEGIRYPRVAAVTVLPLVLCSLGGECRRVRLW